VARTTSLPVRLVSCLPFQAHQSLPRCPHRLRIHTRLGLHVADPARSTRHHLAATGHGPWAAAHTLLLASWMAPGGNMATGAPRCPDQQHALACLLSLHVASLHHSLGPTGASPAAQSVKRTSQTSSTCSPRLPSSRLPCGKHSMIRHKGSWSCPTRPRPPGGQPSFAPQAFRPGLTHHA
jgi:hypothetical protein